MNIDFDNEVSLSQESTYVYKKFNGGLQMLDLKMAKESG